MGGIKASPCISQQSDFRNQISLQHVSTILGHLRSEFRTPSRTENLRRLAVEGLGLSLRSAGGLEAGAQSGQVGQGDVGKEAVLNVFFLNHDFRMVLFGSSHNFVFNIWVLLRIRRPLYIGFCIIYDVCFPFVDLTHVSMSSQTKLRLVCRLTASETTFAWKLFSFPSFLQWDIC